MKFAKTLCVWVFPSFPDGIYAGYVCAIGTELCPYLGTKIWLWNCDRGNKIGMEAHLFYFVIVLTS